MLQTYIQHCQESIARKKTKLVEVTLRDLLDLDAASCHHHEMAIVDALVQGFMFVLPMNEPAANMPADDEKMTLRQRLANFRGEIVSRWPLIAQQFYLSSFHGVYLQKQWIHPRLG